MCPPGGTLPRPELKYSYHMILLRLAAAVVLKESVILTFADRTERIASVTTSIRIRLLLLLRLLLLYFYYYYNYYYTRTTTTESVR